MFFSFLKILLFNISFPIIGIFLILIILYIILNPFFNRLFCFFIVLSLIFVIVPSTAIYVLFFFSILLTLLECELLLVICFIVSSVYSNIFLKIFNYYFKL